jgi:hypothetical protein
MATVIYTPAADITSQNPSGQANDLFFAEWPNGFEITNGTDLSGVGQQANIKISRRFGGVFKSVLQCGVTGELHIDAKSPAVVQFRAANTTAGSSTANTIATLRHTGTCRVIDAGGGNVTNCEQTSGELVMSGSTIVTNARVMGGNFWIEYNATGLSSGRFTGCRATVRRGFASNSQCLVTGGASVLFARSQTVASSGISITGGSGLLTVGAGSSVNWQGGVIDAIELTDPTSTFGWQDMYESVTFPLIRGDAQAIFRTGLRTGSSNVSRFGATITVTAIAAYGKKVSEVGGDVLV